MVSLIGAMFAPRPELAVAELIRVCCPGGRIVMGSWTPLKFTRLAYRFQYPFPTHDVMKRVRFAIISDPEYRE